MAKKIKRIQKKRLYKKNEKAFFLEKGIKYYIKDLLGKNKIYR